MKSNLVATVLLSLAGSCLAQDNFNTGNNWNYLCGPDGGDTGHSMCGMFIMGFINGVNTQATHFKSEKLFCFPDSAQIKQGRDVFAKFLTDHPEIRHFDVTTLATISLIEAFPCPTKKRNKYSH